MTLSYPLSTEGGEREICPRRQRKGQKGNSDDASHSLSPMGRSGLLTLTVRSLFDVLRVYTAAKRLRQPAELSGVIVKRFDAPMLRGKSIMLTRTYEMKATVRR